MTMFRHKSFWILGVIAFLAIVAMFFQVHIEARDPYIVMDTNRGSLSAQWTNGKLGIWITDGVNDQRLLLIP